VTYPLPASRGLWRLTLHNRVWGSLTPPTTSGIGELVDARSRRLDRAWNAPAQLTFTVDGRSPTAANIIELQHDVIAWRWDSQQGRDVPMFRGIVGQSEDQLTEQAHVVTFTCHDYLAMVARRYITTPAGWTFTQVDQDSIVQQMLVRANSGLASDGVTNFLPGSAIPLQFARCYPDGTVNRPNSGTLRDRTYTGSTPIGQAIDDLARVIGGFDYDHLPTVDGTDQLRVFFPYQGVERDDLALVYGSNVATLTRTISSQDYANYWRILGNQTTEGAPQMYAEAWNADANNVGVLPIGLWANVDNAADVSIQSTLDQKAQGNLATSSALVPSYTLGLRPGAYAYGKPNMGDIVPLVVQSGRLNVNTTIRVLGISYSIGDDGQEDVELTVGRPANNFLRLMSQAGRDADALTRR
jgi:hypothetical protein